MIIFDLDGTLADCEHRRHFVDNSIIDDLCFEFDQIDSHGRPLRGTDEMGTWFYADDPFRKWQPDWKSFYEACEQDSPIKPTIEIFYKLIEENDVQIWSGRCESVRARTLKWLHNHVPRTSHIKEIKMRPIGDSTPDDVLKEKWLDEAIAAGHKIDMVFDDRPKVIRMWRRRGIFVFNCCQHDKEF